MRIQKYLAHHSPFSRRKIEQLIAEGRITINQKPSVLGQKVSEGDQITVCNQHYTVRFVDQEAVEVLMLNKPLGVICSTQDHQSRPSIYTMLPKDSSHKWFMVGRLDVNTSGLILFTNRGDLANRLMHPSTGLIRRYHVRVYGDVKADTIKNLLRGVRIDGQLLAFKACTPISQHTGQGKNSWYEVEVASGQNRMVRKLWESQSIRVSRLVRVAYGSVHLPKSLRIGESRFLSHDAVIDIMKEIDYES